MKLKKTVWILSMAAWIGLFQGALAYDAGMGQAPTPTPAPEPTATATTSMIIYTVPEGRVRHHRLRKHQPTPVPTAVPTPVAGKSQWSAGPLSQ